MNISKMKEELERQYDIVTKEGNYTKDAEALRGGIEALKFIEELNSLAKLNSKGSVNARKCNTILKYDRVKDIQDKYLLLYSMLEMIIDKYKMLNEEE